MFARGSVAGGRGRRVSGNVFRRPIVFRRIGRIRVPQKNAPGCGGRKFGALVYVRRMIGLSASLRVRSSLCLLLGSAVMCPFPSTSPFLFFATEVLVGSLLLNSNKCSFERKLLHVPLCPLFVSYFLVVNY